jgi:membrane protein YqaA with SNARE-associated domain
MGMFMDAPAPTNPVTSAEETSSRRRPHWLKRLYLWVLHWAETPYGTPALFGISFAESSFFPIPPDVLQIALSVSRPKRSFFYAAVNAIGSVLGGIAGWLIGWGLWASVDQFFFQVVPGFTPDNFAFVQSKYAENAFLAIFAAAFTPIPFKVFTIAAGVFQIPLGVLILASALGRSARFFAVAALIYVFGPSVKNLIDKYFELATCLFLVLLIGGFVAIKFFTGH